MDELEAVWARHGHLVTERVLAIRAAAAPGADGAALQAALNAAHTLAGSLGTLGEPAAGEVAAELEALLAAGDPDPPDVARLTARLIAALPEAVRP